LELTYEVQLGVGVCSDWGAAGEPTYASTGIDAAFIPKAAALFKA